MNRCDEPSRASPVEADAQPLASLIARVEAATGPDRELDRAIAIALGELHEDLDVVLDLTGATRPRLYRIDPEDGGRVYGGDGDDILIRPYTASLDAATALVERVLPGWRVAMDSDHDRHPLWGAMVRRSGEDWPSRQFAKTPALALLAALLRAVQAQPNRHDARDGSSPQSNEPSK